MRTWTYPLFILAVTGGLWISSSKKACEANLFVVNASGQTLTKVLVQAPSVPGVNARIERITLAPKATAEFKFSDFSEGSYTLHFTESSGDTFKIAQGYLVPKSAFNDTLYIHSSSAAKRCKIRQTASSCQDAFHWRSFLRHSFRSLLKAF